MAGHPLGRTKTQQGRERCAQAKTVHGWETREIRRKRDDKLREQRQFERDMQAIDLIIMPEPVSHVAERLVIRAESFL